jgi:hypothetical protein
MNLFITLLENVNKSRTSANNVSLTFSSDLLLTARGRERSLNLPVLGIVERQK